MNNLHDTSMRPVRRNAYGQGQPISGVFPLTHPSNPGRSHGPKGSYEYVEAKGEVEEEFGAPTDLGFATDASVLAKENPFFRQVLYSEPNDQGQLTVMSLDPHENIGLERHPETTQLMVFESGTGEVQIGSSVVPVTSGSVVVVPPDALHDVVNTSDSAPLGFLVFYTHNLHKPDSVESRKTRTSPKTVITRQ